MVTKVEHGVEHTECESEGLANAIVESVASHWLRLAPCSVEFSRDSCVRKDTKSH